MPDQPITITTFTLNGQQDCLDFMVAMAFRHPQGLPGLVAEQKTHAEWEQMYQDWIKEEDEKNAKS